MPELQSFSFLRDVSQSFIICLNLLLLMILNCAFSAAEPTTAERHFHGGAGGGSEEAQAHLPLH